MNGAIATLIAVIAGVAAVITAIGGVLLAIRTVRNRERKALTDERNQLEVALENERQTRVNLELRNYEMRVLLAKHGVPVPAGVPDTEPAVPPEPKALPPASTMDGPDPEPKEPHEPDQPGQPDLP